MGVLTFDDLLSEAPVAAAPAAAPNPQSRAITFDDIAPEQPNSTIAGQAKDVLKSAGASYLKGVAGLVGMLPDAAGWAVTGADTYQSYATGRPYEEIRAENDARAPLLTTTGLKKAGTAAMTGYLEDLGQTASDKFGSGASRKLYEPQTTAGKLVGRAAEFLPGAALAPGSVVRNALAYGVGPGVASESVGLGLEAVGLEDAAPIARAVTAVGTGVGLGLATRPNTAGSLVSKSAQMTPAQVDGVEALIRDARDRFGIDMTRAEAAQFVTGDATNLGNIQRVVEGSGGLNEFYAGRAGQVERAGRGAFDNLAPAHPNPAELGPQVQGAARAGVAATPEGQALSQRLYEAGPRVTPEQAGQVIQPELRGVYDRREGARAAVAEQDYAAARNSDSWVPVDEKLVDVARTTERPMTPQEVAAQQAAGPKAPAGPRPASLAEYIARNGGIALDGDAAAAGLDKFNVPFGGNVARPNGKSIDSFWREKLMEDGYLPYDQGGGVARDIKNELHHLLGEERMGKPTYSAFDADKVSGRQTATVSAENTQALDAARSEIIRDHYRAGVKPADLDPVALERAAEAVASGQTDSLSAYSRALTQTPMVTQEVTQRVPQTVYGQASPNPVIQHIDRQLETAKGGVAKDLEATKRDLYGKGGTVEGSVEGLQNARAAINKRIDAATTNGRTHAASVLVEVRNRLDRALEQVPEQAVANANFKANSAPLAPFDNTPPIARAIAQDKVTGTFTTPPERVPGTLQEGGPSTARVFNDVAPPAARQAYEQHLTTQVLDAASQGGADLSASSIRDALRQNEDLLAQYPGVRDRLRSVAVARDGLERIQGTPLVKLANARPEVQSAIDTLFPVNPVPNSAGEAAQAIQAVAERNPLAARQLVRTHAESVFNEATQSLPSGLNQFGGATFAAVLRGNPQQAENLKAIVQSLPQGETTWAGFDRFLEIMEATGHRQRIGSNTEFNREIRVGLKTGGSVREIASAIATGGFQLPGRVMNRIDMWNAGRNVDNLARLLTEPEAAPLFRHLVTTPPTSAKAGALIGRLTAISHRPSDGEGGSSNR